MDIEKCFKVIAFCLPNTCINLTGFQTQPNAVTYIKSIGISKLILLIRINDVSRMAELKVSLTGCWEEGK